MMLQLHLVSGIMPTVVLGPSIVSGSEVVSKKKIYFLFCSSRLSDASAVPGRLAKRRHAVLAE